MTYGSVCSGIEAATVAWHPLGWAPAWFSEIEAFPCRLLAHHYPHISNLGDMLKISETNIFNDTDIDLLVGGTPCQSFSVAGLRAGLADPRGNLALGFCRILAIKRPRWFVWENVPGVLTSYSNEEGEEFETSDFANILQAFRQCGYSCSWRVLDAQYFGVPQRRRRVFVVGHLGDDWRPPAAVLFEPEGLRGHSPEGRKAAKEVADSIVKRPYSDRGSDANIVVGTLGRRTGGRSIGAEEAAAGQLIPCWWDGGQVSQTLDRVIAKGQAMPEKNRFPAVLVYPYNQITSYENRSNPQPGDPSCTISKRDNKPLLVSFQDSQSDIRISEVHGTLKTGSRPAHAGITDGVIVRRLTPLECERLQGFPDSYTAVTGGSLNPVFEADTPRYESIGNSMAVPVMRWIGERIDTMDKYLGSKTSNLCTTPTP